MKGLLIKDIYMAARYCRTYLFITVGFIVIAALNSKNTFFLFYPSVFCGAMPVTLLAYDERSRWLEYSQTMPYTKGQIVGSKYILGLSAQVLTLTAVGIAQAVRQKLDGAFRIDEYAALMSLLLCASLVASSICMPFMFRWGVEKGRIAYYAMVGVVCALSVIVSKIFSGEMQAEIRLGPVLFVICLVCAGIYALSWYLSVVLYKKREM